MKICINCKYHTEQNYSNLCSAPKHQAKPRTDYITGRLHKPNLAKCYKHNWNGQCPEYLIKPLETK